MSVNIFPESVVWSVGLFRNVTNGMSQNALLNRIFSELASNEVVRRNSHESSYITIRENVPQFVETVMTLYRLYHDQQWDEARVYFYMMTGVLMIRDEPVVTLFLCNYSKSTSDDGELHLDPLTINGLCDRDCSLLNELWFDYKDYYHEDDDDESGSEENSEDDDESSSEDDDGSSGEDIEDEDGTQTKDDDSVSPPLPSVDVPPPPPHQHTRSHAGHKL